MVAERKIKEVERILNLLRDFKNVCIVEVYKTPNLIIKKVREKLKKMGAVFTVTKKRLFKIAVEKSGREDVKKLIENMPKQLGLIFSNENALSLFSTIKNIKVNDYAKEGDVASRDIWIRATVTDLPPGPIITELSNVGLKVGVEGGKVAVKEDKLLVKKGEKITKEIASVLQKFDIKPIEICLNITTILNNGFIFKKEVLDLIDEYPKELETAYKNSFNLTLNINYPTKENINLLISKFMLIAKSVEQKIKS